MTLYIVPAYDLDSWLAAARHLLFGPEPIIRIQHALGLGWPLPFRALSLLGTTWGVILVVGLALWLWGRETAYALVGIVLLETWSNLLLNQIFSVPRPDAPGIVKYEQVPVASFPSGHVYTATVLWGLLYARGKLPLFLCILVVGLVSLSRLYLGVHFLGDVLGGLLLGVFLVSVYAHLRRPVWRWFAAHTAGVLYLLSSLALTGAVASLFLLGKNPVLWNAAGLVAAGSLGLPLEHRYIRYSPASLRAGRQGLKVLIGLAGILPALLVDRLTGEDALALGAGITFLATLWAVLVAPAVFVWMGMSSPTSLCRR